MVRLPAAFLLCSAALFAQPRMDLEHYQLPNGMKVVLHPDHTAPFVHVNLRFFVGAKNEAPGRTGFAHLFEHMMGENADAVGGFLGVAEAIGATDVNANTYMDSTDYHATVPSSRLERMLWLDSNQWATLPQRLTQERFNREREIVINELRQRIDNVPYAITNRLIHRYLFPPGHPYSHDALGSPADLTAASLDEVREFYRTYYTPDYASLVVSGDFDPSQTKTWILKYFGSLAPGPGVVSPEIFLPPILAPKRVEVSAVVPFDRILFAWPAPGAIDPDNAALAFARFILDERWHEKSFRDRIHFDPIASSYQLEKASVFFALNESYGEIPLDQVRSTITAELAGFARDGPTEEEVQRARNNLESEQVSSLENLSDLSFTLNEIEEYYGGAEHFADWLMRYRNVTADSIRKAVGKWLLTPNFLTIHFTPITARHGDTSEPDRTIPPPFQPEKPLRIPEIQSAKLPNGLQIFVVERHNLPRVAVQLRFNLGFAETPDGKPGVAIMTMLTLACATPTRTGDQIKKEIVNLAASVNARADAGTQYIGFDVLKRNFDPMFSLMSDILLHSLYPEDSFGERKSDVIANYVYNQGSIDGFGPWVGEVAFGPTHPLGAIAANPEKLRDLTAADVREFQDRYWHPDSAVLVFAGDITLSEAAAAAAAGLGSWNGNAKSRGKLPPPAPMKGRTFLLERKGVDQTRVLMIIPGLTRDNPDYPAMLLANHVLGSGFFSRLYHSIRLDRGIAYDVDSALDTMSGDGLWVANSAVQADKTREAMALFTQELSGFAGEKPITQAELDVAKQIEIRTGPQGFESNGSTVGAIAEAWTQDKSLNSLRTFEHQISAVTLDQINAAVRKYAQADKAIFLLVGDPTKIGSIDGLVTLK